MQQVRMQVYLLSVFLPLPFRLASETRGYRSIEIQQQRHWRPFVDVRVPSGLMAGTASVRPAKNPGLGLGTGEYFADGMLSFSQSMPMLCAAVVGGIWTMLNHARC